MSGLTFWILTGGSNQWIPVHLAFVYAHQRSPACRGQTTIQKCVSNLGKLNFTHFGTVHFFGSMAPTIYLIRCQELHRHDQNCWSQQQLSLQVARANLMRWQFTWKCSAGRREGETCIWSTSLESKAVTPNLSHSAFSCCAMVVSGTTIEVVEPGMKWTGYWFTNKSRR